MLGLSWCESELCERRRFDVLDGERFISKQRCRCGISQRGAEAVGKVAKGFWSAVGKEVTRR